MGRNALDRHLALVGFMGAGKSTLGEEIARRLDRVLYDIDSELESEFGKPVERLFDEDGEEFFRELEAGALDTYSVFWDPLVIVLGGGAVETPEVRERLREMCVVHIDVDVDSAWERVKESDRPLARDEREFRERYERRRPLYAEVPTTSSSRRPESTSSAARCSGSANSSRATGL